jgi:hypothetical protein
MTKPFLFQFLQPVVSPGRATSNQNYIYDERADMVRWIGSPEQPFAIYAQNDDDGPTTKKCDIEKGEDKQA